VKLFDRSPKSFSARNLLCDARARSHRAAGNRRTAKCSTKSPDRFVLCVECQCGNGRRRFEPLFERDRISACGPLTGAQIGRADLADLVPCCLQPPCSSNRLQDRSCYSPRGDDHESGSEVAAFFTLAIGPADALAEQPAVAAQPTILEASESVYVRLKGPGFAPNSTQDDVIQGRITIFDETQRAIDAALDRNLRICRGC
jgi:hypothetical protein